MQEQNKPQLKGKKILHTDFEKTSYVNRCAFEVVAHDQGAQVTYIDPNSSQIGHKESMKAHCRESLGEAAKTT